MAEEDCLKKLDDMQAIIYIGFPIRSIHLALSFTFTINACNAEKVFIWLVSVWEIRNLWFWHVSTSSSMFGMETNGETDHLQHDLFVDISYKFFLALGIVSYACTRITMNTCLSGKKIVLFTWIQCFMMNAHTFNNHKAWSL